MAARFVANPFGELNGVLEVRPALRTPAASRHRPFDSVVPGMTPTRELGHLALTHRRASSWTVANRERRGNWK